ncbi:MAG TPA: 3-phosphoshikimate 1-carboxyvinyltransferase [Terriglobales bacterium]|nr:3-phosphoshikimate 1-carboxyvinyltransferase [Terriglobales bacterium]
MRARPFTVRPGGPLRGVLRPPGDKSITHRACILGLLAEGETLVRHPNEGEDCRSTLRCIEALGAKVVVGPGLVWITGTGGRLRAPDRALDCGNSGTTLRLLAGVLAAQPFESTLTGDDSLRGRPVDRVIAPLRRMGASLSGRDGDRYPPLVVRGGSLVPCPEELFRDRPTPSAQVASAVLLAALHAPGTSTVFTRAGARDHTVHLLRAFGVPVDHAPIADTVRISLTGPARPRARELQVPGDVSAAAFFLAGTATTPKARIDVEGVDLNPTRTGFLEVMERMGARPRTVADTAQLLGEPVGAIVVTGPERIQPTDIEPREVPALVDEIPAWAILAAGANGVSRLRGAAELRVKESDRLHALAEGLTALGVLVDEVADGLDIHGGPVRGGLVRSFGDHRIAMAFAVLGTRAMGPVTIDDASSIATTYPGFVDDLRALGGQVEIGSVAGERP